MKFQNPSIHHSKVNTQTDTQTDRQTDKPKAICPSNFFKVGGIISVVCVSVFFFFFFFFLLLLFVMSCILSFLPGVWVGNFN